MRRFPARGRALPLVTREPNRTCEVSQPHYSQRSATNGSTVVARRAGTNAASVATDPNISDTVMKVNGSNGVSPNSMLSR
jgi:hypothetical protein